jgi:type II secretory pathway pseudopilin PulG
MAESSPIPPYTFTLFKVCHYAHLGPRISRRLTETLHHERLRNAPKPRRGAKLIANIFLAPILFFSGAAAKRTPGFRLFCRAAPLRNRSLGGAAIAINMAPLRGLGVRGNCASCSSLRRNPKVRSRGSHDNYVAADSAAFTLTDLMVLVATISLLSAIAVVAGGAARQKSRLARCTSNLQAVNHAVLAFCADNAQTLPTPGPTDSGSLWWFYKEQVKRYAGLNGPSSANDLVFACPDDRGYSDPKPFHLSQRFDYGSYVFNGVSLPGVPNIAGMQLSSVKLPQRTLLVMEWTAHAPLSWHKSKTGKRNMPFYCDAQSVVGFVDGHVALEKIYYDGYNAAYTQDPPLGYTYQYTGN